VARIRQRCNTAATWIQRPYKCYGSSVSSGSLFRIIFPPLVNDATEAGIIADVAADLVGADNVNREGGLVMASEDFS
jgi:hypothetical protein